ncbi:hypothetical protein K4039_04980 [Lyngbya sp. CCAP 1446/10]|nr:hypothetical protein [Lyngbya sp. CCAP 1446/10]MCW6049444.1 hypothetical protein [Lyngbya sp. CCAP 1446/10]
MKQAEQLLGSQSFDKWYSGSQSSKVLAANYQLPFYQSPITNQYIP